MKNVYGYVRVSTVKQGEGVSLDEQKSSIEAYAQKNQLKVIEWFEEKVTAAKQGRPLFTKMIKLVRAKKADGIIIHKIDRSARNLRDWASIGELMDIGIEVHFSFEAIDFNTRGGRLSADIQAVIAADYIRNLKAETIKGFYGRLKQGILPLPAPLGYLDMGAGIPKKIDPTKGELIKKAFELYSTGNYGVSSLAEKMNDLGLTSKKNNPLTKNAISLMLNNPYYYGLIKIKTTGETFLGKHQALIGKRLFDQVQDILLGRKSRTKIKHQFPFRRAIRCLNCNYSLIGEYQKGHSYYRCHTKGCPTQTIREETVLLQIRLFLQKISFSDQQLEVLEASFGQLRESGNTQTEDQVKQFKIQVANLENRERSLMDALLDELITKEEFKQKKSSISHSLAETKRKLETLKKPNQIFSESFREFLELLKNLSQLDPMTTAEEIRQLAEKVTSNLFIDRKKLLLEPISELKDTLNFQSIPYSGPYLDRPPEKGIEKFGNQNNLPNIENLIHLSGVKKKKLTKKQYGEIVKNITQYCLG